MDGSEIIKEYLRNNNFTRMKSGDCTCNIEDICGSYLMCEPS
jgi:hypothetical protein